MLIESEAKSNFIFVFNVLIYTDSLRIKMPVALMNHVQESFQRDISNVDVSEIFFFFVHFYGHRKW